MSIVSVILISLFLSSQAEARHGRYDYLNQTAEFGCNNCAGLGVGWYGYLPRMPRNTYQPPRRYQVPIWPTLPAKRIPYVR